MIVIISHEKGLFFKILEFLLGETLCKCNMITQNIYKQMIINKDVLLYFEDYIKNRLIKCCGLNRFIKNVLNTKDYIKCNVHKLTDHDVSQFNSSLEKYYNGRFDRGCYNSASSWVDTSDFVHTENMDNFEEFIKKFVDSNKVSLGNKCCSGRGIKIIVHPMYL
tara:strand:+ start:439 stop:930 length:492 start_codon:yes stop_codon:yes gene_type:complete